MKKNKNDQNVPLSRKTSGFLYESKEAEDLISFQMFVLLFVPNKKPLTFGFVSGSFSAPPARLELATL